MLLVVRVYGYVTFCRVSPALRLRWLPRGLQLHTFARLDSFTHGWITRSSLRFTPVTHTRLRTAARYAVTFCVVPFHTLLYRSPPRFTVRTLRLFVVPHAFCVYAHVRLRYGLRCRLMRLRCLLDLVPGSLHRTLPRSAVTYTVDFGLFPGYTGCSRSPFQFCTVVWCVGCGCSSWFAVYVACLRCSASCVGCLDYRLRTRLRLVGLDFRLRVCLRLIYHTHVAFGARFTFCTFTLLPVCYTRLRYTRTPICSTFVYVFGARLRTIYVYVAAFAFTLFTFVTFRFTVLRTLLRLVTFVIHVTDSDLILHAFTLFVILRCSLHCVCYTFDCTFAFVYVVGLFRLRTFALRLRTFVHLFPLIHAYVCYVGLLR